MTARKYLQDRKAALEAELDRTRVCAQWDVNIESLRILRARIDEIDLFAAILDARSDKSARTAEDHTA
jgi:hypothetical protein